MLIGGKGLAYAICVNMTEQAILSRRHGKRRIMLTLQVEQGHPRQSNPLVTTPMMKSSRSRVTSRTLRLENVADVAMAIAFT